MLDFPPPAVLRSILSTARLGMLFAAFPLKLCLPYFAGAAVLIIGVIRIRKEFSTASGMDRITLLGPMFLAVPMAVFGADHFVFTRSIVPLVPSWIPAHLFWVLFVGTCLVAGALSLVVQRYAALAADLFATMLFLFVVLLWIPQVLRAPGSRLAWAYALRDLTFGAGALSFAAAQAPARFTRSARLVLTFVRTEIGFAAIFFAIEHFLHPEFLPGVPLEDLTPRWFPGRVPVGYFAGVVLLITGLGLVLNKWPKLTATALGLMLLLLVVVVYVPIVIMQPRVIETGLNYLADTLMFCGIVLCFAGSYRRKLTFAEVQPHGQPEATNLQSTSDSFAGYR